MTRACTARPGADWRGVQHDDGPACDGCATGQSPSMFLCGIYYAACDLRVTCLWPLFVYAPRFRAWRAVRCLWAVRCGARPLRVGSSPSFSSLITTPVHPSASFSPAGPPSPTGRHRCPENNAEKETERRRGYVVKQARRTLRASRRLIRARPAGRSRRHDLHDEETEGLGPACVWSRRCGMVCSPNRNKRTEPEKRKEKRNVEIEKVGSRRRPGITAPTSR